MNKYMVSGKVLLISVRVLIVYHGYRKILQNLALLGVFVATVGYIKFVCGIPKRYLSDLDGRTMS